jgi:hypothetical protein
VRIIVACAFALMLVGCTDCARLFPLDPAAKQAGTPRIDFEWRGLGRGPVTVTMPDGEILHGEYQITKSAAGGVSIPGVQIGSTVADGSSRHVVISANSDRGTIINCDGATDTAGRGSGTCETSRGYKYRVTFLNDGLRWR